MGYRKTKIVCTLGPATDKDGVLEKLVEEGMDVARFNFSHGDHEEQLGRLNRLKDARAKAGRPVAALLDTKGPEIRIRDFAEGKVMLKKGQEFTLTTQDVPGDEHRVSITYEQLVQDVKAGDSILIDDGLVELLVKKVTEQDIVCEVKNDGALSNKKGVNVPDVELNMPYIDRKSVV